MSRELGKSNSNKVGGIMTRDSAQSELQERLFLSVVVIPVVTSGIAHASADYTIA
jgi:hypothetical protein